MINLIIDTNIYRGDIGRNTAAFQTLEALIKKSFINLHVPNFVEREFLSQLNLYYIKCYEDLIKNLSQLTQINFLDTKTVHQIESEYFRKEKILDQSKSHFENWLENMRATRYDLELENYQNTFNDYFEGNAPFKRMKNRSDIPDSLVFQNIRQIYKNSSNVHFISEDKNLLKACNESMPEIKTYISLDTFIKSDACKPLINTSDESIILDYCRGNASTLTIILAPTIPNALSGKQVESYKIPDDNHEGNIISASEPETIDYEFDNATYYGDGVLVVPCSFTTEVELYYYLYKADYASMDQVLTVSDHSDHYYEVSQNFEVFVTGTARFEFEINKTDDENILDLKNSGIDSLSEIEVI